jgi:hypothetical protein
MIFGNNVLGVVPPTGPVRIWDAHVQWCDLEKEKDVWDWSILDKIVNDSGKRSIMIVLGHPPAWAAKGGPDGRQAAWMAEGSNRPPANMDVWKKYIRAVVMRYKDRVRHFQIWNEPADKRFYSGTWAELGMLSKVAYAEIKSIDSKLKVVSPPLQPRRQAGWAVRGKAIMKSMKDANYPFDIWSCHVYPQKGEGAEGFERDLRLVRDAISLTPRKQLWITEMNYNLGGDGNPYPPKTQTLLKSQTKNVCVKLDIGRAYWYAYAYNNPSLIAITAT